MREKTGAWNVREGAANPEIADRKERKGLNRNFSWKRKSEQQIELALPISTARGPRKTWHYRSRERGPRSWSLPRGLGEEETSD